MKTVLTHTGKIYVDTEHRLEFLTVGEPTWNDKHLDLLSEVWLSLQG